ncbi:MAG: DUF3830 family protein [Dehalococcoidia bacterium]
MTRYMSITLTERDVRCIARLLDDEAPRTAEAVWQALPLEGDAYHAKYARNEVYTFVPPFAASEPGLEHPTITPIPGDVCYFAFSAAQLHANTYGYGEGEASAGRDGVIDLAIFYGRNNLLLNADIGWVPGNVFASIVEGLDEMAAACNDIWRAGAVGERLRFERVDDRA